MESGLNMRLDEKEPNFLVFEGAHLVIFFNLGLPLRH